MDIYEIKQRAEALSAQTDLMSILPTDVGDLINDLATVVNENNINGAQLGIKQTYESVAAMNEATSPVDYDGNPLKKGNLVIIYNESNVTDNNKIYTYLNPGWSFVTLLKNFENTELFYEIPGDITALNEGEGEDVVNKVKEVFGTIDGWFFVNQINKDFLIDKNGITMSYRASSVGAGNYMFYISYYAQGVIVDLELFARQIFTSGPPTLDIERVTINKNPHILWDNSSNMNNYKDEGIFIVKGVHSNSGDNMPITAYANGNIGAVLSIAKSTVDESTGECIIGQHLVIANKVGGETKEFIRSCIIKNDEETWTPWKESSMIQIFGEKSSGIAMRADIDAAIDNGQYAGVYMGSDGFLPQGATFTLITINNYAANATTGQPNNRQVTQIFIYTPLSTTGKVVPSKMVKRDGFGGDSISWSALESVGGSNEIKNGDIVLPDKTTMTLEDYKASKRSDAIGVIFDARKGLFVKKNKYTGVLIGNQDRATNIFCNVVRCKDPYDGKVTQKMNLLNSLYWSSDFPVFSYAEENGLYVASNGELAQMHTLTDSLDAIGSDYGGMANIASCTQVPLATTRVSVFYGGAWEDRDTRDPLTSLSYFLIDIL